MIQKVQSAAPRRTVIGDFNHFNFQKVLERRVTRPGAPLWHSPGIRYGSVGGFQLPMWGSVHALD